MPHSHRELFYHLIWSTKDRFPLIQASMKPALMEILHDKAAQLGCRVFAANAVADHVHMLLYIPPSITVARTVRELKGVSAYRLRESAAGFAWQGGYGIITLRRNDFSAVTKYIENQETHHRDAEIDAVLESEIVD